MTTATSAQAQIIEAIFGDRYRDRGAPFWDAYEQGQFARATGVLRSKNPFGPLYPGYFHVNMSDWFRGWDAGVPNIAT